MHSSLCIKFITAIARVSRKSLVYPFNTHTQTINAVNVLKIHDWYPQPWWLEWSSWHHVYQCYHSTFRATPSDPVTWWWDRRSSWVTCIQISQCQCLAQISVSSGLRWNDERQENVMLEITISSYWSPKTITSTNFWQFAWNFLRSPTEGFKLLRHNLTWFSSRLEILSHIMQCLWSVFLDTVQMLQFYSHIPDFVQYSHNVAHG